MNTTTKTQDAIEVPEGYRINRQGHLVPLARITEAEQLRDEVVMQVVREAERLNSEIAAFYKRSLEDIQDLVKMAGERWGVQLGGSRGNLTLISFDGDYKVVRQISDMIGFTEEIEVARALLNECIDRWGEGSNDNLRLIVDRTFRTTQDGNLRKGAVLDLMSVEIDDAGWQRGIEALRKAIEVNGTAVYVRAYQRERLPGGKSGWRQIAIRTGGV